ncbi:MAG TPA: hypothetical protein VK886_00140 [Vicinamibacterales bacterium]|nr:hypothetical protein [Vicinamibacterales bacterium]
MCPSVCRCRGSEARSAWLFAEEQLAQSCTYTFSAASATVGAAASADSVTVTAANGCVWDATSNSGFLTVMSGGSGNGNSTVVYSVAANSNKTSQRTLTIAGQTYT